MKLNRLAILAAVAVCVAGLTGAVALLARADAARPAATVAKATPAPPLLPAVQNPKPVPDCAHQDQDQDDDATEAKVKKPKEIDDDDVELECGNQKGDDGQEIEDGPGHHEGHAKKTSVAKSGAPHKVAEPSSLKAIIRR